MLPIEAAPLRDGAVLIGAEGRIVAVGSADRVPTPPDAETVELPDAVLLPGLVNTHTHLELTGFAADAAELDFPRWILHIRQRKLERPAAEFLAAARRGLRECWAGGVTTVADTGDSGAVIEVLHELQGSGIAYHEVFGPHPDQLEASFAALVGRCGELSRFAGARVRLGVSPHAPYTVSGPLYARVAGWARTSGLPLAVHLAESPAESALVAQGTGPFAQGWQTRGIPLPDHPSQAGASLSSGRAASPVQWLDRHGVLGPTTLCIHAVQLDEADIRVLAERGAAVAHCPGSNAAHRHGAAPQAALRRAGIRVGLGTDSVASVGPLDLFREARAARDLGGLTDAESLALATRDGARALGLASELGSLVAGKWGDVIAVRPPGLAESPTPEAAVLRAGPSDVVLTVLEGRIVHRHTPA